MITAVGVLAGLVISLLIIIIKDLSDTTVREDSFMTNELGLTNLGEIASITMPKDWTLRLRQLKSAAVPEDGFRRLAWHSVERSI